MADILAPPVCPPPDRQHLFFRQFCQVLIATALDCQSPDISSHLLSLVAQLKISQQTVMDILFYMEHADEQQELRQLLLQEEHPINSYEVSDFRDNMMRSATPGVSCLCLGQSCCNDNTTTHRNAAMHTCFSLAAQGMSYRKSAKLSCLQLFQIKRADILVTFDSACNKFPCQVFVCVNGTLPGFSVCLWCYVPMHLDDCAPYFVCHGT